jgi:hypothetical protein
MFRTIGITAISLLLSMSFPLPVSANGAAATWSTGTTQDGPSWCGVVGSESVVVTPLFLNGVEPTGVTGSLTNIQVSFTTTAADPASVGGSVLVTPRIDCDPSNFANGNYNASPPSNSTRQIDGCLDAAWPADVTLQGVSYRIGINANTSIVPTEPLTGVNRAQYQFSNDDETIPSTWTLSILITQPENGACVSAGGPQEGGSGGESVYVHPDYLSELGRRQSVESELPNTL